jgi:hypothetical protein
MLLKQQFRNVSVVNGENLGKLEEEGEGRATCRFISYDYGLVVRSSIDRNVMNQIYQHLRSLESCEVWLLT